MAQHAAMQNTFAIASPDYAAARPTYPEALFDWIAGAAPARGHVWDCATGNGQAGLALAERFAQVEATDLSAEQVASGFARPNIRYSAQPAEATNFANAVFDAVTVAQALHWFDHDRFWPEVARVSRPGALFCAWGYDWFQTGTELDARIVAPFRAVLEPYWAANNRILWNGYAQADIRMPFDRIDTPVFEMAVDWSVPALLDYFRTWSAWKRAKAEIGARLEAMVAEVLTREDLQEVHRFTVPLHMVAGRVA